MTKTVNRNHLVLSSRQGKTLVLSLTCGLPGNLEKLVMQAVGVSKGGPCLENYKST